MSTMHKRRQDNVDERARGEQRYVIDSIMKDRVGPKKKHFVDFSPWRGQQTFEEESERFGSAVGKRLSAMRKRGAAQALLKDDEDHVVKRRRIEE